jgi:hypothetical protein
VTNELLDVHRRSAPESVIGFDSSCKLASRSPAPSLGAAVCLDRMLREAAGCETAVPARPCHAHKPSQPPQPCVWPWRPSRAARRVPLDLPTRAARRGKHAARRCRGLEALRRCLEPLERYPRARLPDGGLQRCERRWNEVIPALAGTPLLEGLEQGRNPLPSLDGRFVTDLQNRRNRCSPSVGRSDSYAAPLRKRLHIGHFCDLCVLPYGNRV